MEGSAGEKARSPVSIAIRSILRLVAQRTIFGYAPGQEISLLLSNSQIEIETGGEN
jgi:hypothetical protein